MASGKKPATTDVAEKIIKPVLEEYGLSLWDVRFEKEGSQWYLRYLIDNLNAPLTIQDCENVSRDVGDILDEQDPIQQSYILEVGSPGIERELVCDEHFARYIGSEVSVKFIRPVNGEREFIGELVKKDGKEVTILIDEETEMTFEMPEVVYVRLYVDFDDGGTHE